MQKIQISVYELEYKSNKRFDAFMIDEPKSVKTKIESNISEEDAVHKICKKILGDKVFKYKKIEKGIVYNTWEAEIIEATSSSENIEIYEIKPKKSRAEEAKKRREKQKLIQFVATQKAEENLKKLCISRGLNKTQVINKLLEEKEQLSLL